MFLLHEIRILSTDICTERKRFDSRRLPSADIRLHCLTKQVEHAVLLSRYIFYRKLLGWRKHFIFSLSLSFSSLFNPALSFCAHARDRYCELAHYVSCHCSTVSQLSRQLPSREHLFQPSMVLLGFMKLLRFPIHTFLYRFVHPLLFAVGERTA